MSDLPGPAGPDHHREASGEAPERDETLPGNALPRSEPFPSEAPSDVGVMIGPDQLRHMLGEGGMGEVWLAEQQHPIRRRVALEIIKRGALGGGWLVREEDAVGTGEETGTPER